MILTLPSLQGFSSRETSLLFSQIILLICSSFLFHSMLSSNFLTYSSSLSFLSFIHLFQFLSSFLKYSSSNFLSFHLYNNFTIYFPGNSIFLNLSILEFNSTFYLSFIPSYFLTSTPNLCHMQVHLSGNNVPMVKPPLNHTSLPFTAATFLATCLMAVLQPSGYSIFHSRDTPIQLSLL